MYRIFLLLLAVMLASCQEGYSRTDQTSPINRADVTHGYRQFVQPILNRRCVVCHGCYDAPCQLKLSSAEGLLRGANPRKVYNGTRLIADDPTRLFIDAHGVAAWRNKGFFSVTDSNDADQHAEGASVMYRMLQLKSLNPLTGVVEDNGIIPERLFDFSLDKTDSCPTQADFYTYSERHPMWGMPYGLPEIPVAEAMVLKYWLRAGAPVSPLPSLPSALQQNIAHWERFLNGDSLKQRLMSRYLFEHLFLAHLYFPDHSANPRRPDSYFQLVRSSTPSGQDINVIATRRPYDDPGVARFYYRLQRIEGSITAKNHLPYALDDARMAWISELFLRPDYRVDTLPGYDPMQASNPFRTFAAIPAKSRYRFMLQEARFTIAGFMKGAVCRGQIALNVINDHFWVLFVDPDLPVLQRLDRFLNQHSADLRLPAERQSNAGILGYWTEYSQLQANYLEQKSRRLVELLADNQGIGFDWIWHGDGVNPNAALTVFRHFDSASVIEGLAGNNPKTAWLIDYPILERIHYLLVAGFDVYGNVGHQLSTRLYMDFLRMESEFNFLALLPRETRVRLREQWYQGASGDVKDYVYGRYAYLNVEPAIRYPDPLTAKDYLFAEMKRELAPALAQVSDRDSAATWKPFLKQLAVLEKYRGNPASIMPEMGLLMIEDDDNRTFVASIIRNSDHSHITSVLFEASNRRPQNDYLTVLPGVVGAYPDALWHVRSKQLGEFVDAISRMKNENDYARLMSRYGIRRSNVDFWELSDQLHRVYRDIDPVEYGILDYNRLENR